MRVQKAMASGAKQFSIIAKVEHTLGFQAFCEEQQRKNCARSKPRHKATVVKAKADCISPALTPQKPPTEILWSRKRWGHCVLPNADTQLHWCAIVGIPHFPMLLCYPVPMIHLPSAREVDVVWRQ